MKSGNSLVVRTLHFHHHGLGSAPSQGTKITPQVLWHSQKKKSAVLSGQGISKEADWPVEILHVKVCATAWLQAGSCYLPQLPGLHHGSSPLCPQWLIQALSTLATLVCQGYHRLLITCLHYCSLFLAGLPDPDLLDFQNCGSFRTHCFPVR